MGSFEQTALVQGWADTRSALGRWRDHPASVLRPWAIGSLLVGVLLLGATYLVAVLSEPDPTSLDFPGLYRPAGFEDYLWVLFRNSLVLALHGLACVAGFMAGSSLPTVAQQYTGVMRWIHDKAGPMAIAFVIAATLFSLFTQAYILGGGAATLAFQLDISEGELILGIMPHALPELFALFLPLAAWTMASRARRWQDLLAATFVTVGIAIPILLGAAAIEVFVSPELLRALSG
jgi:hypothetical protein